MQHKASIVLVLMLASAPMSSTVLAIDSESLFERNFRWVLDRFTRFGVPVDGEGREEITGAARFFEARGLDLASPAPGESLTIDGSADIILECGALYWGPQRCSITTLLVGVETQQLVGEVWGESRCELTPRNLNPGLTQPDVLHVDAKEVELYVYGSDSHWPLENPHHEYYWTGKVLGNGCYAANQPGWYQLYYSNGVAYREG